MLRLSLIIVGGMLVAAQFDWPYGYYQLLRIVTTGTLVWFLLAIFERAHAVEKAALILLAVSYNPLFKISMEREAHAVVNLITVLVVAIMWWRHREAVAAT